MLTRQKLLHTLAGISALLLLTAALASGALAQSTGGAKGKVRSVRGSGIGGATITARQKGVDIRSVKANSKGEFVLDGLESGRYNLVFDAPGYGSGVLYNVEVEKRKVVELPDRLILTADRGMQVIVKGSVFFKEGNSIAGAKVEVRSVNSDGSTRRLGSVYTSSSGEFTFRSPQGVSKLRFTASFKEVEGSKEIEVDEPAIYRLAISLDLSVAERKN